MGRDQIPVARIGLGVRVTSVDDAVLDERGEIVRLERVDLSDWGDDWYIDMPIIRLDSGRELAGCECWWTTADDVPAAPPEAAGRAEHGE